MASVGRGRDTVCIWDQLHTTLCYIYWYGGGTLRSKKRQKSGGWLSCMLWWVMFGGEPILSGSGCSSSVITVIFTVGSIFVGSWGPRNMKDHAASALVLHSFLKHLLPDRIWD